MENTEFIDLLTEFLAVPSPSGREERTAHLVGEKLDEMGYRYETDRSGNVLVRLNSADDSLPKTMIAAWTFDDRAGVIHLLRLLKRMKQENLQPRGPMIIAFTVHEEGGCHGAKVLAHREQPDTFIAVDGCPVIGDNLAMDGRPGVWTKDKLCHYSQPLVKELLQAAKRAGTQAQVVIYEGAFSDASQVYSTGGRRPGRFSWPPPH